MLLFVWWTMQNLCLTVMQIEVSTILSQAGATLCGLVSRTQDLVSKLKALQLDRQEFVCLKYLVLFNPGELLKVCEYVFSRSALMELPFACRCEVCAEPQAGGADSGEGQQGSDGAHATAPSQTVRQVRPTAAAPARNPKHQLAGGGVFVSAPPSGRFALQLSPYWDAAHQAQLRRGHLIIFILAHSVSFWPCVHCFCPKAGHFTASSTGVQENVNQYQQTWGNICLRASCFAQVSIQQC